MASELFVNKITGTSGTSDDAAITLSGNNATLVNIANFTGMIAPFAMSSAPTGWLTCDGTAVSRTTYSDLYTAIGTTWGSGDGTTTFNLPDLRGAFLRGTGSHGTSNMANGNDFAGPSVGSFENDQIQEHGHNLDNNDGSTNDYLGGSTAAYGLSTSYIDPAYVTNVVGTISTANYNSNGEPRKGDETRPFNAGINYCIKI